MIYVENDFYSNFNNAVKSNDDRTIQDMLIDQFSTLIANRRGEVIQLFQKIGIPLSAQPSNEELSTTLVNNLMNNKKLQGGMAYLIAKENDILASSEKPSRADSETAEPKEGKSQEEIDYDKTANTVTAIAGTIGVLAESLRGERANQFQQELQNKSNTKAPNYSASAYEQDAPAIEQKTKKKKTWVWVLVGLAAAGGIYYAYKKGYIGGKGKAGDGIEVPPIVPTPTPVV